MSKIYFGYTTSTFGLKGELKCFTDFERKDLILKKNHPIYIKDQKHILSSIRAHKGCFLIRIDNHEDINEVEEFRHQKIFIEREELELKNGEFLFQDIIGFSICEEGKILGIIKNIRYNKSGILLSVVGEKTFLTPYNDFYIKEIVWPEKKIIGQNIKGLML